MWLREMSSCSWLTVLPVPAWLLLNKTCPPFSRPLYSFESALPTARAWASRVGVLRGHEKKANSATSLFLETDPLLQISKRKKNYSEQSRMLLLLSHLASGPSTVWSAEMLRKRIIRNQSPYLYSSINEALKGNRSKKALGVIKVFPMSANAGDQGRARHPR